MISRRLTSIFVAAALAAVPAGAMAQSGEDQYCDPFEGCGTSTGGNGGGTKRPPSPRGGPRSGLKKIEQARLVDSVQASDLERLRREAERAGAPPELSEAYRRQLQLRQARAVLDAAGLSSLRLTVR